MHIVFIYYECHTIKLEYGFLNQENKMTADVFYTWLRINQR